VHIPDGFLSTPVWAALDVFAASAVTLVARRAQKTFDESQVPLMGVLGAFVFAAQMIDFPVGPGVTGHLLGGALLAFTLGPAAASVVMTAILAIQALVFQDGGLLALGANIFNMALAGVLVAYIGYFPGNSDRWRRISIFGGGALSVLISGLLALSELRLSGVPITRAVLTISLLFFAVAAVLEGMITLAVLEAVERIQPGRLRGSTSGRHPLLAGIGVAAVLLSSVGVLFAATAPDAIERLGLRTGVAAQARALLPAPLASYHVPFLESSSLSKAVAGLCGLVLVYGFCLLVGRGARKRSL
jgi:cobalt/nickel transport system permease protein